MKNTFFFLGRNTCLFQG